MGFGLILYLFICLLLIVVSLLNQNQSGGLGILSGSSNTLLGTAHASFLSKVISFLAVIFFIGALFFSIISSGERVVLDEFSPDDAPIDTPADDLLEPESLEDSLEFTPEDAAPPPDPANPLDDAAPPAPDLVPLTPTDE